MQRIRSEIPPQTNQLAGRQKPPIALLLAGWVRCREGEPRAKALGPKRKRQHASDLPADFRPRGTHPKRGCELPQLRSVSDPTQRACTRALPLKHAAAARTFPTKKKHAAHSNIVRNKNVQNKI